jgi:hypothetical protein
VIDRQVAASGAADGDLPAVREFFRDGAAGPHSHDMWPPCVEERVLLRAGELVFARSHCGSGECGVAFVAPA